MNVIARVIDRLRSRRASKEQTYWSALERVAEAPTEQAAMQSLEDVRDVLEGVDPDTVHRDLQLLIDYNRVRAADEHEQQCMREVRSARENARKAEEQAARLEKQARDLRTQAAQQFEAATCSHGAASHGAAAASALREKLAQAGHPAFAVVATAGGVA